MVSMFNSVTLFNQDISNWETQSVKNMGAMFKNATAFDQDIGNWNTSGVINMYSMFQEATSFNQDLSDWCVSNISAEPSEFSINSLLTDENIPIWGSCP